MRDFPSSKLQTDFSRMFSSSRYFYSVNWQLYFDIITHPLNTKKQQELSYVLRSSVIILGASVYTQTNSIGGGLSKGYYKNGFNLLSKVTSYYLTTFGSSDSKYLNSSMILSCSSDTLKCQGSILQVIQNYQAYQCMIKKFYKLKYFVWILIPFVIIKLYIFFTKQQITQLMSSDQQCAFDNWEQAAEQLQKEEQIQKQEGVTVPQKQETNNEVSDAQEQQKKSQKQAPLDPKQILKKKIATYETMSFEEFQEISDQVTESNKLAGKKVGNPVLKSDKDFNNYARQLAKRFDNMIQNEQATVDDEKLSLFFQELTLYMYKNLEWKNLHQVQAKLKVIKKQRKSDEDKQRKQKEKQERLKKTQGEGSESKSQSVTKQQKTEDLFGGAGTINSKQQEEERKNKIIVEQVKKQEKVEEDDDDFM